MPYIDVKGVCTLYSEYGENQGTRVLFLHGLGSSSATWRDIPIALSKYFHTITVDLVGFGGSDKPDKPHYYEIKGFSKFILDFLETIEIKDKINIVGHSLGGYIAAGVAIDNKERIEKLVLIDSSGTLNGPTPLLELYQDAAMEPDSILRYKKVQRVLEDLYADRSRLLPVVVDTFIGTLGQQGAKPAFEKTFKNSTNTHIDQKDFRQIRDIPCLIIWGQKDNLIPVEYANEFKKVFDKNTDEFILIEDAGHAPFVEKTALVYDSLRTFLSKDK